MSLAGEGLPPVHSPAVCGGTLTPGQGSDRRAPPLSMRKLILSWGSTFMTSSKPNSPPTPKPHLLIPSAIDTATPWACPDKQNTPEASAAQQSGACPLATFLEADPFQPQPVVPCPSPGPQAGGHIDDIGLLGPRNSSCPNFFLRQACARR